MQNSVSFLVIISIVGCSLGLNPQIQSVQIPTQYGFASANETSLLVTSNFGVLMGSSGDQTFLLPFGVGESFNFENSTQGVTLDAATPQLIYVDETSFLVFSPTSNGFAATLYSVSSDLTLTQQGANTFEAPQTPLVSASAFVTVGGNLYLSSYSTDNNSVSVYKLDVSNLQFSMLIDNVLPMIQDLPQASWSVVDMHSLPRDGGVALILSDGNQEAVNQVFVSVYFNGTAVTNAIPSGQVLTYVGRHRGSSFGYTIGGSGEGPYSSVTSWDFATNQVVDNVQIKGFTTATGPIINGHFATADAIFCYSNNAPQGLIYELPYSEGGILPNSVNNVEDPTAQSGNLGSGTDGQYIYAVTSVNSPTDSVSRWSLSN